jgi:pyruvate/2-oxoglutarate dehydrogenase complex dihydrolipoamide dehydrogenase (E3) component
MSAHL